MGKREEALTLNRQLLQASKKRQDLKLGLEGRGEMSVFHITVK